MPGITSAPIILGKRNVLTVQGTTVRWFFSQAYKGDSQLSPMEAIVPLDQHRLEREHRALSRHLFLMSGLLLLLGLRTSEYDENRTALYPEGINNNEQFAEALISLKDNYIPGNTKARMFFDELREASVYVTGPLELFFCLSHSMIERIRLITRDDPRFRYAELEQFITCNATALDAIKDLRDWLLHPSFNRQPERAVLRIQESEGKPDPVLPYETAATLFQLLKKFVGIIHDAKK